MFTAIETYHICTPRAWLVFKVNIVSSVVRIRAWFDLTLLVYHVHGERQRRVLSLTTANTLSC